MTITQAIKIAEKMISKYPELRYWRATYNNRKRAFGVCDYGKKQIELSSLLVPAMSEESIKDTIIHEIAHALCPGQNHNNVWKAKCIELGGNGKRCGGSDKYKDGEAGQQKVAQQLAKYTLTCPVCGEKSYKNRKPTKMSSCGICNPRTFDMRFKLELTQNY